jgi:hypothetical protein
MEAAARFAGGGKTEVDNSTKNEWRNLDVDDRLSHALVKGIDAARGGRHRGGPPEAGPPAARSSKAR